MRETIQMCGEMTLMLTARDGTIVTERHKRNRIVTSGRRLVAELFAGPPSGGAPPAQVTHMAVGTGDADSADTQTALVAEVAPRKPITDIAFAAFTEGTGADAVQRVRVSMKAVFDFAEANSAAPLREAGIFTAVSGGVMYNRVKFEPVTKTDAFQLTLLWDIVF